MTERQLGIVKWFNDERGLGFIKPDADSGDVYVEANALHSPLPKSLKDGPRVAFFAEQGPKGLAAIKIEPI